MDNSCFDVKKPSLLGDVETAALSLTLGYSLSLFLFLLPFSGRHSSYQDRRSEALRAELSL